MANEKLKCADCWRLAHWLWGGNSYDAPRLVCGIHKRKYLNIYRLVPEKADPR